MHKATNDHKASSFVWNILTTTSEINDTFWKVIMQCDATSCIICITNELEYLDNEKSYKNSAKEVTLYF